MNVIADTNILVRALMEDEPKQSSLAQELLLNADLVAIPAVVLCELCWVLTRSYKIARADIMATIRSLISSENVAVDASAVEAGLAVMDAGGDFADGIIADHGQWLGGDVFASFDEQAIKLLERAGRAVYLPNGSR
jgi:predicted nucleic-acid-binding protein